MAVIKIDPDKLTKEFEKRNLMKGDVSEEMGHNRNYFADIIRRGTIPKPAVVFLMKNYNISPEEYTPDEKKAEEHPEKKQKPEEVFLKDMTDKQAYRLIYSAVYHAVKRAWSE